MVYQVCDDFTGEILKEFKSKSAANRYRAKYAKALPPSERLDIFVQEVQ